MFSLYSLAGETIAVDTYKHGRTRSFWWP
jgi:hypothetical protein